MMPSPCNIAFMGSDPIGIHVLECLAESAGDRLRLAGVITQPDRPKGRGKKLVQNAIKLWAQEADLPVFQPEKLTNEHISWLEEHSIDLVFVMAYGQIIPTQFLERPRLGTFNFHASILPEYRGASPIEAAIHAQAEYTGVTLMELVPKMDAGPIVDVEQVAISLITDASSLRAQMSLACLPLLDRNLNKLLDASYDAVEQDPARITYARKLIKDDAWIDFNRSARAINAQVRAFHVWPKSCFEYNDTLVKVGATCLLEETHNSKPGTVLPSTEHPGLRVAVGEGSIIVFMELQRPGGSMMDAKSFLLGFPIAPGSVLKGKEAHYPILSEHFQRIS